MQPQQTSVEPSSFALAVQPLQKGGGRRGSHQRLPSQSMCVITGNDTIDSQGDFEDEDDEDISIEKT